MLSPRLPGGCLLPKQMSPSPSLDPTACGQRGCWHSETLWLPPCPMIIAQSCLWLCGWNLLQCHACLYFSFQTSYADTRGRNFIDTFEMHAYKGNTPKSCNLVSVVNKEWYVMYFLLFWGDFIYRLRMLREFTSLQVYLALLLWWSIDCTMISEEAAL